MIDEGSIERPMEGLATRDDKLSSKLVAMFNRLRIGKVDEFKEEKNYEEINKILSTLYKKS